VGFLVGFIVFLSGL